jgi:hypothetical protein
VKIDPSRVRERPGSGGFGEFRSVTAQRSHGVEGELLGERGRSGDHCVDEGLGALDTRVDPVGLRLVGKDQRSSIMELGDGPGGGPREDGRGEEPVGGLVPLGFHQEYRPAKLSGWSRWIQCGVFVPSSAVCHS